MKKHSKNWIISYLKLVKYFLFVICCKLFEDVQAFFFCFRSLATSQQSSSLQRQHQSSDPTDCCISYRMPICWRRRNRLLLLLAVIIVTVRCRFFFLQKKITDDCHDLQRKTSDQRRSDAPQPPPARSQSGMGCWDQLATPVGMPWWWTAGDEFIDELPH